MEKSPAVSLEFSPALRRKTRAGIFIERIARKHPELFAHWQKGMFSAFA